VALALREEVTDGKAEADLSFGYSLLEGLRDAAAWKRGVLVLEAVDVNPMPPERGRTMLKRLGSRFYV
jgi:putative transcriptional regulator